MTDIQTAPVAETTPETKTSDVVQQTQADRDAASLELLRAANQRDAEVATQGEVEEPASEETPPEPSAARQLSVAYRKEKALRKREESLNPREARVTEAEQIFEAVQADKKNALKALEVLGVTLEDLVDAEINRLVPGAIDTTPKAPTVEDRLAAIEKQREEQERLHKEAEERRVAQETAQLAEQRLNEHRQFIEENAEKYPLLARTKGTRVEPGVLLEEARREYFFQTRKLLDYNELAETVEETLREEAEAITGKSTPEQKTAVRAPTAAAKTIPGRPPKDTNKGQIKTLTNNLSTRSVAVKDPTTMTQEERDAASLEIIRRMHRAN